MALLALLEDLGIDAAAIVGDAQSQVVSIVKRDFHAVTTRVGAGVSNRLVADPVDLVADYRMQLLGVSSHSQGRLDWMRTPALVDGSTKCRREIVLFRR